MTDRTPSEAAWLRVSAYRDRERYALAVRAAADYPPGLRVAGTPLLAPPAWRLPAPVPLDGVRLEFRPDAPRPDVPDLAALAPGALPLRADGTRYRRYSDVIAALAAPAVFENRPTYRLIQADLAGRAGRGWPSGAAGSSTAPTPAARQATSTPRRGSPRPGRPSLRSAREQASALPAATA